MKIPGSYCILCRENVPDSSDGHLISFAVTINQHCQTITEILTHAQQWAHLLTQELFPSDCPMIQPPLREYSRPGPENPAELEREREFFILFLGQGTQAKYKHTYNSINITKPDKVTHSYKEAKISLVFDLLMSATLQGQTISNTSMFPIDR